MGLLSRFRKSASTAEPELLYRRSIVSTGSVGGELSVIRSPYEGATVLPSFLVEFAEECHAFAPLSELVAAHAEKYHWDSLQLAELRKLLPSAIEAGLLVSTRDLRAACPPVNETPARIETIGVGTGGARLALLEKCVRSFAENMTQHGRAAEFLVAENSSSPETAARCHEAIRAWSRDYPGLTFRFADHARKVRFIERLAKIGACSPSAAEFALLDPLGSGFSCGANRNALLLHGAGQMLACLDDDVACHLHRAPEPACSGLALFSDTDPYQRWLYPDRARAFAATDPEPLDYLAQHERLLGRPTGDLLAPETDFSRIDDTLLYRLLGREPTRVRASFTGHVGDPGIPTSAYYLYYDGENRERLTAGAAHYASVFPSRSVHTACLEETLGDASVTPGMAMALDHRELLPPFFPVLHAEDFSFGAALWSCCPGALCGHLPLAVAHEPSLGKPILTPAQIQNGPPFVLFEFAHLLRQLIFRFPPLGESTAEQRLRSLGRHCTEIGDLSPRSFHELLRSEALAQAVNRCQYLSRQLEENPDLPDYWRTDVEALIHHLRHSLTTPDFDIPFDLLGERPAPETRTFMQRLLARYGELLIAWPAMVAAARELRENGEGLMEKI